MIRLVLGTILFVFVAIGFGFAMGCLWMKEKYLLFTEDELKDKINN